MPESKHGEVSEGVEVDTERWTVERLLADAVAEAPRRARIDKRLWIANRVDDIRQEQAWHIDTHRREFIRDLMALADHIANSDLLRADPCVPPKSFGDRRWFRNASTVEGVIIRATVLLLCWCSHQTGPMPRLTTIAIRTWQRDHAGGFQPFGRDTRAGYAALVRWLRLFAARISTVPPMAWRD